MGKNFAKLQTRNQLFARTSNSCNRLAVVPGIVNIRGFHIVLFCDVAFEQPDFFREAQAETDLQVLKVIPHDFQHRFLDVILQFFSELEQTVSDHGSEHVWSYLAPELRENCSFCTQWIGIQYGDIKGKLPEAC